MTTDPVRVQIKKLHPAAILPAYHSELAAGMDLSACLPDGEAMPVEVGRIVVVPLGFAIALPPGFEGQVRPRSGLASKHGITVPNAPGTVDADYRGEMKVALINLGRERFEVTHGMRIAQLVIARVSHATLIESAVLDETGRGAGGFGSTGA